MKYSTSILVCTLLMAGLVLSKKKLSQTKSKAKAKQDSSSTETTINSQKMESDGEGNSWYTDAEGDTYFFGPHGDSSYVSADGSYTWTSWGQGDLTETWYYDDGFEIYTADGGYMQEDYGYIQAEDANGNTVEGHFDSEGDSWGYDSAGNYYESDADGTYIQCTNGESECATYKYSLQGDETVTFDNGDIDYTAADGLSGWNYDSTTNTTVNWEKTADGTEYNDLAGNQWFWGLNNKWYWSFKSPTGFEEEWWYDKDGNYFYEDSTGAKEYIYSNGNSYYYLPDQSIEYDSQDGDQYIYDPTTEKWSEWNNDLNTYVDMSEAPVFHYS